MLCRDCATSILSRGNKPNTSGLCFTCYQRDYSKRNRERKRVLAKKLRHLKLKKYCSLCSIELSIFNRSGFCTKCYRRHFQGTHSSYLRHKAKREMERVENKLRRRCRDRLRTAVDMIKSEFSSLYAPIGCSPVELKQYLESKFTPGMSWDNYGKYGWHIDHIRPLASFDLNDPQQLREACHYTNLQPLWARDNLTKGIRT